MRIGSEEIRTLVHGFYDRVRGDPGLGPFFAAHIEADAWPEHLARMCRFWETALIGAGSYRGDPMAVHRKLPGLEGEHFGQWLGLFAEVARGCMPEDVAAAVIQRAERMGQSLAMAAGTSVQRPARRERGAAEPMGREAPPPGRGNRHGGRPWS